VTSKIYFKQWQKYSIVLMFVLTLFAQIFLPIQSHTRAVQTDSGRTVVLCTLQGYQTVQLDEQGRIIESQYESQTQTSAAVKFSQLLAHATPVVFSFEDLSPEPAPSKFTKYNYSIPAINVDWHFSVRAPPLHA